MANKKAMIVMIALSLILGITMFAAGCGGSITGSSNIETREMNYSNFTKLEIGIGYHGDQQDARHQQHHLTTKAV